MDVLEELLYCNRCNSGFLCDRDKKNYSCRCRSASIKNNIPRFVDTAKYADNFGFEWKTFKKTQLDSYTQDTHTKETFFRKTGWSIDNFSENDVILDVGCGAGRFIEVIAQTGAQVIGVDISTSVDAAYENVGHYENVRIIQSDVFDLPFRQQTFTKIYSIGVLHHTPSTSHAFSQLPPLLKANGEIAIWVYRKIPFAPISFTHIVRWLWTNKMTYEQLMTFSQNLDKYWYPIVSMLKIGDVYPLRSILLASVYPNKEWRILNNFDAYSPKYNHQHTFNEVVSWFKKADLKNIEKLGYSVAVRGNA